MVSRFQKGDSSDVHSEGARDGDHEHSGECHPTLNEIQIRAYRVHREHGELGGGYTLDDWLEAEHELNDELKRAPPKPSDSAKSNQIRRYNSACHSKLASELSAAL